VTGAAEPGSALPNPPPDRAPARPAAPAAAPPARPPGPRAEAVIDACPNCGAPMHAIRGSKQAICRNCGFKDSCCF